MNRKARFAVAACLLTGAVGYLMYSGIQQTAVYYLTINEFLARKDTLANEGIRVAGRVEVGSVTRKMTSSGEELNFRMGDFKTDGMDASQGTVPVYFICVTPDMFKSDGGSDVIVEGKYRDGIIHAQSVLTSCPSKYEPEQTAQN